MRSGSAERSSSSPDSPPPPGSGWPRTCRVAAPPLRWQLGSGLDRQDRDALDPVLGAGVSRPLGDELVRVLLDVLDAKPGALDRLPVRVLLGCASDARRPQVGVADDRLLELLLAHDVGDRQPAAGLQDPRGLGEDPLLLR